MKDRCPLWLVFHDENLTIGLQTDKHNAQANEWGGRDYIIVCIEEPLSEEKGPATSRLACHRTE